ncbi:MAG: hypothetical protein WC812_02470 [Candidatus Pacearchaeota archaeon]|jgi:hypothetical protein
MKKELIILFVAMSFIVLVSATVMAEDDSDFENSSKNMTFGNCVAQASQVRQECYQDNKNILEQCNASNLDKDRNVSKQCSSDYKETKKNCKINFKESKTSCIQTYKPNFWERMNLRNL